jgi:hypothetical protein
MKTIALVAALLATSIAHARPQTNVSFGPVLSVPEIAGAQVSFWPDSNLTIDLRATLSSIEGGVTGHIPIAAAASGARHDIVLTALGGFVHRGVRAGTYGDNAFGAGGRILGAVGYGYQGAVDFRIEGGLSAYDATDWQLDPTFFAFVGFFL